MASYKTVAVFGCTSGIGPAIASLMIRDASSHILAIGRRQDRLESFVSTHGADKATAYPFDITSTSAIPAFVSKLTSAHPDLSAVFLNAGIQRQFDFTKPESVDLDLVETELKSNYLSQIALVKAFLPYFLAKPDGGTLVFTSSGLALVPSARVPNYCATKAALHSFVLALREQLRDTKVKVVEVIPPAVQTELHDEKHQPGRNAGKFGMDLGEFSEAAWKGLKDGKDYVPVGMPEKAFERFEERKLEMFEEMAARARGASGK